MFCIQINRMDENEREEKRYKQHRKTITLKMCARVVVTVNVFMARILYKWSTRSLRISLYVLWPSPFHENFYFSFQISFIFVLLNQLLFKNYVCYIFEIGTRAICMIDWRWKEIKTRVNIRNLTNLWCDCINVLWLIVHIFEFPAIHHICFKIVPSIQWS